MPHILVNLTGTPYSGSPDNTDTVYISPFGAPSVSQGLTPLPLAELDDAQTIEIHRAFAAAVQTFNQAGQSFLQSISNVYLESVVLPACRLLRTVHSAAPNPEATIELCVYAGDTPDVQLFGVRSMEIDFGHHAFLSRIMERALTHAFPGRIKRTVLSRRPWFIRPAMVRTLRRGAGLALGVKYALHVIGNRLQARNSRSEDRDQATAVLVRTTRQAEIHRDLSAEPAWRRYGALVLPHLLSRRLRWGLTPPRATAPTVREAFLGWRKMRRDMRDAARNHHALAMAATVSDLPVRFDLRALLSEALVVPSVFLNRYVLDEHLSRNKTCKRLISFELFGHNAFAVKQAADNNDVNTLTIQSVTIPHRRIYGFPVCDRFFSDSYHNFLDQSERYPGAPIVYAGTLTPAPGSDRPAPDVDIGFYTQPNQHDINLDIVKTLIRACQDTGKRLMIRFHPRDARSNYDMDWQSLDHVIIDEDPSLANSINRNQVIVTRTSAIARTAIALEIPVVHALFSEFDRSIDYDYIDIARTDGMTCDTAEGLYNIMIKSFDQISANTENKRKALFRDLFSGDLDAAIASYSASS